MGTEVPGGDLSGGSPLVVSVFLEADIELELDCAFFTELLAGTVPRVFQLLDYVITPQRDHAQSVGDKLVVQHSRVGYDAHPVDGYSRDF